MKHDRRQLVEAEGHLHGKALHLHPLFSLQTKHELLDDSSRAALQTKHALLLRKFRAMMPLSRAKEKHVVPSCRAASKCDRAYQGFLLTGVRQVTVSIKAIHSMALSIFT